MAQPVDYIAREANNTSLGKAGEQFVILFERARLIKANKENLATKVEQISLTEGASAGFDILSFDESGKERFIEVKTTAFGASTPFFVTQNEVSFSRREENQYFLYRTFNFRKHAKLFTKQGSIDKSFELEPSQYLAKII